MAKKQLELPRPLPRREAERRAQAILKEVRATLPPDRLSDIVAINFETGEYVLGADYNEAHESFRRRWPGVLVHMVRADGGPVFKFHGK
jgi:hypothetical protein